MGAYSHSSDFDSELKDSLCGENSTSASIVFHLWQLWQYATRHVVQLQEFHGRISGQSPDHRLVASRPRRQFLAQVRDARLQQRNLHIGTHQVLFAKRANHIRAAYSSIQVKQVGGPRQSCRIVIERQCVQSPSSQRKLSDLPCSFSVRMPQLSSVKFERMLEVDLCDASFNRLIRRPLVFTSADYCATTGFAQCDASHATRSTPTPNLV